MLIKHIVATKPPEALGGAPGVSVVRGGEQCEGGPEHGEGLCVGSG